MPFPEPSFPDEIAPETLKEIDALCAQLTALISAQHDSQGAHADITATSVSSKNGYKITGDKANMGEWISPAFATSFWFAAPSMTWTVQRADVQTYAYTLIGNTLFIQFAMSNTSVGGTPNGELRMAIPGGFTAAKNTTASNQTINDTVATQTGTSEVIAGNTYVSFYLGLAHSAWDASTNNSGVSGQMFFEIVRP